MACARSEAFNAPDLGKVTPIDERYFTHEQNAGSGGVEVAMAVTGLGGAIGKDGATTVEDACATGVLSIMDSDVAVSVRAEMEAKTPKTK